MGTIQIKKVEKKVVTGKVGEDRQKVKKTYGKIIYRGTLGLADMAEHIMKHGTVYTEAITMSSSVTLKAIAIKDGQSSEVTTKQFVKSDGGADDPSGFEGA